MTILQLAYLLRTVFCNEYGILYMGPADAKIVIYSDSWLKTEYHAGLEDEVYIFVNSRFAMQPISYLVACLEFMLVFFKSFVFYNLTRYSIKIPTRYARFGSCYCGMQGFICNLIDAFLFRSRSAADANRTPQISGVPLIYTSHIHNEHFTVANTLFSGNSLEDRSIITRRYICYKRRHFATVHFHGVFAYSSKLIFTHSGFHGFDHRIKAYFRNFYGFFEQFYFNRVFDNSHSNPYFGKINKLYVRKLFKNVVFDIIRKEVSPDAPACNTIILKYFGYFRPPFTNTRKFSMVVYVRFNLYPVVIAA